MGELYKDFTEAYKEELKSYVKNTTDTTDRQEAVTYFEQFNDTDNKWLAEVGATASITNTKSFQQGIIDLDEAVASKIDTIFTNVNDIDSTEKITLNDYKVDLTQIKTYLTRCEEAIDATQGNISEKGLDRIINTGKAMGFFDKEESEKYKDEVAGVKQEATYMSYDPVNLSTGNLVYDYEDLAIEGQIPLSFHRYYNSQDKEDIGLGMGFVHNYLIHLNKINDNKYEVKFEDGQKKHFQKRSDGRIVSLYSATEILEEANDGYRLTCLSGEVYIFDNEGKLIRQEDRNAQGITFEYEDDKLVKASADTGIFLRYEYSEGFLTRVIDNSNRTVELVYTNNRLTEAILPGKRLYEYGYSDDGGISEITNSKGIVGLSNRYDEKGRVVYQLFPDGSEEHFIYDDESKKVTYIERNGRKVVHVHDDKYRNIENIYEDGTRETFLYNDKNLCVKSTDRNGNTERFAYDSRGNITQYIDKCKKKTNYTYDANNCIISVSVNGKERIKNSYDSKGNLIGSFNCLGNGIKVKNNKKGHPIEIHYADGSLTRIEYDKKDNVKTVFDRKLGKIEYEYDELNRVISYVDAIGAKTQFLYDVRNNLIEEINPLGLSKKYEYDNANNLIKIKDFDNYTISVEYNVMGYPSKLIDKEGNVLELKYDKNGNLSKQIAPNGAVTEFVYNSDNQMIELINANGATISYEYDLMGNRVSIKDALGNISKCNYDAEGNVIETIERDGTKRLFEYDYDGNLVKETNPLGQTKEYKYDSLQNIVAIKGEPGETTCYEYDTEGNIAKIIYPDKTEDKFIYEAGDVLKKVVLASGQTEEYIYDNKHRLIGKTNSLGETEKYSYDLLDRLEKIINPEGGEHLFNYDAVGNLISMVDENGNRTSYEYSPNGNILSVIDALNNKTFYEYDCMGHLTKTISKGDKSIGEKVESYEYDLVGNVIKITNALGDSELYKYDDNNQMIEKIDRDGYSFKMDYSVSGQLSKISYNDGRSVELYYDALNRINEIHDWLGVTKAEYNVNGLPKEIVNHDGESIKYSYNTMGDRTAIVYPDGQKMIYNYSSNGILESIAFGNHTINYQFDKMGRVVEKKASNGITTNYEYNSFGRPSIIRHHTSDMVEELSYKYDLAGNKVSVEKKKNTDVEYLFYRRDALNRLTEVRNEREVLRKYDYDAYGNRIYKYDASNNAQIKYQYNKANQLIQESVNGLEKKYRYDRRGNLTQVKNNDIIEMEYTYDNVNRMIQSKSKQIGTVNYEYNGLGHRVGSWTDDCKITYSVDITKEYGNLLATNIKKKNKNIKNTYFWDGNVVAKKLDNVIDFFLQDDLGSTIALINEQGVTKELYEYDEYGIEKNNSLDAFDQPFGFTGHRIEQWGGYYANARIYNPCIGRFLTEDFVKGDILSPITHNSYQYCNDDPEDYVDKNGKFAIIAAIAVGAAVGAVTNAGITAVTQLIEIKTGKRDKFEAGAIVGSAVEGAIVGGVAAIPGVGSFATALAGGVGSAANSIISQKMDKGKVEPLKVVEDAAVGFAAAGIFHKISKARGKLDPLTDIKNAANDVDKFGRRYLGSRFRNGVAEGIFNKPHIGASNKRNIQYALKDYGSVLLKYAKKKASVDSWKSFGKKGLSVVAAGLGFKSAKGIVKDVLKLASPIYKKNDEEGLVKDLIKYATKPFVDTYGFAKCAFS